MVHTSAGTMSTAGGAVFEAAFVHLKSHVLAGSIQVLGNSKPNLSS